MDILHKCANIFIRDLIQANGKEDDVYTGSPIKWLSQAERSCDPLVSGDDL